MKTPTELIIEIKRWLHGEGCKESYLYRESDRKMCCLGFYARACGYKVSEIKGVQAPDELVDETGKNLFPDWLLDIDDSEQVLALMAINDLDNDDTINYNKLTLAQRQKRVRDTFKEHGVAVRFV